MTAISNDLDYSRIFVNQLNVLGNTGDMALAVSTSGKSPNLIYALEAAREKGRSWPITALSCLPKAFIGFRKFMPRWSISCGI